MWGDDKKFGFDIRVHVTCLPPFPFSSSIYLIFGHPHITTGLLNDVLEFPITVLNTYNIPYFFIFRFSSFLTFFFHSPFHLLPHTHNKPVPTHHCRTTTACTTTAYTTTGISLSHHYWRRTLLSSSFTVNFFFLKGRRPPWTPHHWRRRPWQALHYKGEAPTMDASSYFIKKIQKNSVYNGRPTTGGGAPPCGGAPGMDASLFLKKKNSNEFRS